MNKITKAILLANTLLIPTFANAETNIFVDPNVKHVVGDISEFDRSKYIIMHSMITTPDWNGEQDKIEYLFDDLDVYFGRDNGTMLEYAQKVEQDPNRPGYADPQSMEKWGKHFREQYYGKELAYQHKYEDRFEMMIGGQLQQFWLGKHTGKGGWTFKNTDAVGEFMGRFVNEFYRNDGEKPSQGHKRPKYLEVVNEPIYDIVDVHGGKPIEVFEYHNEVAESIRKHNDSIMIGGYTTAFPWFDENNFKRWDERMKLFIDTSGEQMDFFSIHLYDFGYLGRNRGEANFRGGRIEATMDMMEQYQMLTLGEVKPFLISEYGGRDHKTEKDVWSAKNDWQTMKPFSPMMLQFMAKPDQILKAIPFSLTKAEWHGDEGRNYPWRLLRHNDEKQGQTGSHYVYSDIIKFYELWANVKGTRVDSYTNNADVLVDSYVDGDDAYLIISNLINERQQLNLNIKDFTKNNVAGAKIKQLMFHNGESILTEANWDSIPESISIQPEATIIIEYSLNKPFEIAESSTERKYYADTYLQPISKDKSIEFNINNVKENKFGEGVLRLSFGRKHKLSQQPKVLFNGTALDVPSNLAGDGQDNRPQFFSMMEIAVPNDLIKQNNTVTITYPDNGGFVTTAILQTFEFTSDLR